MKALLASNENVVTKIAIAELQVRKWLYDGSLQKTHLIGANLHKADLRGANLQGAYLEDANLQGTHFGAVKLEGASLSGANLQGAVLMSTKLQGAALINTKLQEATLIWANLQHANMWGVECDEKTTLPDFRKWTPDVDWSQFGAVEIADVNEWIAYLWEHGLLDDTD